MFKNFKTKKYRQNADIFCFLAKKKVKLTTNKTIKT